MQPVLDFFKGAHNFIVQGGKFEQVQYAFNYTFNIIHISTSGTQPATVAQVEQAEDRAHTPSFATPSFRQPVICRYSFMVVGVVSITVGVASIRTPSDCKIPTSSPPPSLPPALLIYGRDKVIREAIDEILQKSEVKKHIAVRGGPGMGKTTIATGIIHHPRIAQHFGKARHWVDCRDASDIADGLKTQKLLEYISDSLGLDLSGSIDHRKNIKYFLDHNDIPRIIVLDNFETMWEPPIAQEKSEGVLKFLARFSQLTILITTRNAHDPATHLGVSWHQSDSIQPLSLDASRRLFTSLTVSKYIDSRLDDLLHAVDCIPLPIVLLASFGQENYTASKILEMWNSQLYERNEIQPRKNDSDPINKLDPFIAMSLDGPLIKSTPEAPTLLRIIASLPGGIRRENLQRIVPLIHDVDRVAGVLVRTSLLVNSPDTLQMHSTIRSYMLRNYLFDASHKGNVQAFYFQLIHEAGNDLGTRDFSERALSLSREEPNAEALLLNALEDSFSTILVLLSADYTNYLVWNRPSIYVAKKTVELIRDQLLGCETGSTRTEGRHFYWPWYMHNNYLWDEGRTVASISAGTNAKVAEGSAHQIGMCGGISQHPSLPTTESLLPLALLRLGTLYFRLDYYPKAMKALEEALDRFETVNQLSWAAETRIQLAELYRLQGESARALQLFSDAYRWFEEVENTRGMSACLRGKGLVHFRDDQNSKAVETIMMAQKTCSPDDHTCIVDCERELGRVYRSLNTTESIRLSAKARDHYLIHGPRRNAAITLYQKSIALYMQGDYDGAEVGLKEAYKEFMSLRNDAQMGYSIYHLAEMNRMRGSLHQALALYRQSESMFKHMESYPQLVQNDTGKPGTGNKLMVAFSLRRQAELHARLCHPEKAKQAYSSARVLQENIDGGKGIATFDPQSIYDMLLGLLLIRMWRHH